MSRTYLDNEGKLLNNGSVSLVLEGNEKWFGAGHNSAYTFEGKDYIIFHSYEQKYNALQNLKLPNWSVMQSYGQF